MSQPGTPDCRRPCPDVKPALAHQHCPAFPIAGPSSFPGPVPELDKGTAPLRRKLAVR